MKKEKPSERNIKNRSRGNGQPKAKHQLRQSSTKDKNPEAHISSGASRKRGEISQITKRSPDGTWYQVLSGCHREISDRKYLFPGRTSGYKADPTQDSVNPLTYR